MGRMAETIICPHCKGTGTNYVIVTEDGKPSIQPVSCVVCDATGRVEAPEPVIEEPATPPTAQRAPELWPILVPLGLFSLFSMFVWLQA